MSSNVCTFENSFICNIIALLKDETQYITWILVLLGWGISFYIARWQIKQSVKTAVNESHNEWVREFREKLEGLEDFALEFWVENHNKDNNVALARMAREIKSLTTIAKEIEQSGGTKYQPKLFKDLRQAITSDNDLAIRPLSISCYQVKRIKETCVSLRSKYKRKG
ncbi:hypothetical protein ACLMPP_12555 [Yersinia enterocolitica]|uniref:hypothetical protein n=1 Tax=Yersinia enterocolitica TaxID=630 RepID=UPI00398CF715